jgi:hypothetical protein
MTHLPHDVAALVELAAAHADGAQPLFEGHLESVASLYQVHPERVERARQAFTTPHARRLASALVDSVSRCDDRAPLFQKLHKDATDLVNEATSSANRMDLLLNAPMELAAVQLGAHPFIVEEARLRLSHHTGARAS